MEILSFIKKNIPIVAIIIVSLLIQAIGILQLPEYISKIVDIGIRSFGIENSVPKVLRESEAEKLLYFIKNDKLLTKNYNLITSKNYVLDDIQLNNEENIYVLKEDANISKMNKEFARAITILQLLNRDEYIDTLGDNATSALTNVLGDYSTEFIFETLESLGALSLNLANDLMDERLSIITDDVLAQFASDYIVDEYEILGIVGTQDNYIKQAAFEMLMISFIIFGATMIQTYCMSKFVAKTSCYIREKLFSYIISLENNEQFSITTLINRSIQDVQIIERSIPIIMKLLIYTPTIFIGAFIKIRKLSSTFEFVLIFISFCAIGIGILTYLILVPRTKNFQKKLDKFNSVERDSLNNLLMLKSSGAKKQKEKSATINRELTEEKSKILEYRFLSTVLSTLVIHISGVYILWQGGIKIDLGILGIGSLMAIMDYLFQISFSAIEIFKQSIHIISGVVSYRRCNEIFKMGSVDKTDGKESIKRISSIEFKDVSFKYPETREYILKGFNLKIESGDCVGIIGRNASGKSTILKLLLKFYAVEKGEILINGININKINTKMLRKNFGVVLQENTIFEGSLDYNIAFGNETLSSEDINMLKDFVNLQEMKDINKEISYKGKNVSGGQKQRISIARALAMDSNALILDSAFSSLDECTKKNIQNNINKFFNKKIVIDIGQEKNKYFNYTKIVEL